MDDRVMNGRLSSLRDSLTSGESSLCIFCIPLVYPQMHAYRFWPENANKTLHSRGLYASCTLLVAVGPHVLCWLQSVHNQPIRCWDRGGMCTRLPPWGGEIAVIIQAYTVMKIIVDLESGWIPCWLPGAMRVNWEFRWWTMVLSKIIERNDP